MSFQEPSHYAEEDMVLVAGSDYIRMASIGGGVLSIKLPTSSDSTPVVESIAEGGFLAVNGGTYVDAQRLGALYMRESGDGTTISNPNYVMMYNPNGNPLKEITYSDDIPNHLNIIDASLNIVDASFSIIDASLNIHDISLNTLDTQVTNLISQGGGGASYGSTIAIGSGSNATGTNSVAIGNNASTSTYDNSVALGNGSAAGADNTIILGDGTQNVGIGTTTPDAKLEIPVDDPYSGLAISRADMKMVFGSESVDTTNSGSIQVYRQVSGVTPTASSSTYNLCLNPYGGSVGIGTTSPVKTLSLMDSDGGMFFSLNDSSYNRIKSHTTSTSSGRDLLISSTDAGTSGIYLKSNGNVGIGTDDPHNHLEIKDTSTTGHTLGIRKDCTNTWTTDNNAHILLMEDGDSNNRLAISYDNGPGTYGAGKIQCARLFYGGLPLCLQPAGGNVGIGTTTPAAKLTVPGRVIFGTSHFANTNVLDLDAINAGAVDALGLRTSNDTNHIVNFYNTAGSYRGAIKGANSSSVTYATSSDGRLKTDIVDFKNGLEKIMNLKPRTYRWKENNELEDGFIAQEVFETLPHFIPFNRFKCDISQNDVYNGNLCSCCNIEIKSNGEDYVFGLDYSRFTPYLCRAIQEQQEIIEAEKAKTTTLETKVTSLESQLSDILSRLSTLENP